jgi:uncharacterized repeat protein (TIGR01451 family)
MAVAAALLAPLLVAAGPVDPAGAEPPAPVPSAARANDPTNIYAVGDSITTATGTGNLGAETPANSWVTGTNGSVNSMRARLGLSSGAAVNLASNGRRMQDFDDQAGQLPSTASYVVVELGGNDLCRDSVPEMTSIASYRQEFLNGLAAVRANAPNALIFVATIPDIYNLWYIRGAESPYNPNPSGRRSGLNGSHFYWDGLSVIPCQSLVADPTDSSAGATTRRLAVRQRNLDFNQVLAEECNAVLRCRLDDGNLFELSSNRIDPYANVEPGPNGYVPFGQRIFTDNDISYNDGTFDWLCPLPGVLGGGTICGDHFHPSLQGQGKLAESGHLSSFQFPDNSLPNPSLTPQRAPDGGGAYFSPVTVDVTATDAEGVRGFEYRVHHPDGSIDPWTEHIGTSFSVPVSVLGTTHVEARAMDINGNLSASEFTTIVQGTPSPGIAASKTAVNDAVAVGGVLEWEVTIENTGDQTLTGVTVDDPTADGCSPTTDIAAGEDLVVECTQDVTAGDTGRVDNTATVDSDQAGPVEASAYAYVCDQDFSDVATSSTFFLDVCWLVGEGVTTGFAGGTYRPSAVVTRQAMAAFLFRMAGEPEFDEPGTATFSDVTVASTFFTEVEWANSAEIITGFGGGLFKPGNPVTRQAMAAFMYRLADPVFTAPGTATFPDVGTGHPFFLAIEWLSSTGITTGFSDGNFRPDQNVTRQSMAAFLHRLSPLLAP